VFTAVVAALLGFIVARSSGPESPISEDVVADGPGQPSVDTEQLEVQAAQTAVSAVPMPGESKPREGRPKESVSQPPLPPSVDQPLAAEPATFSPPIALPPTPAGSQPPPSKTTIRIGPDATSSPTPPDPVTVMEPPGSALGPQKQSLAKPVIVPPAESAVLPAEVPSPPAETVEQAEKRLQAAAQQASSSAEHQAVAQELLSLVDKAILDSQTELAKRVVERALAAARKSESEDLVKQITLLWSELEQPLTDKVKERARQRLGQRRISPSAAGQEKGQKDR